MPHAIAYGLGAHHGHRPKLVYIIFQQRRPRGGAELALNAAAVDGHVPQQLRRGGGGDGHDPVGAAQLPAAHVDGGAEDLIRAELVHQQTHRRHVGHRVQGAYLVEVDLLHRHPVDLALRLGDQPVHRQHVVPHSLRQGQMIPHQMLDPVHPGVVVMVMFKAFPLGGRCRRSRRMRGAPAVGMFMRVLLLPMHQHPHMGPGNAAFHGGLRGVFHPGDPQGVQPGHEGGLVRQQLQQGRRQHIPRRAHGAVEIECFHGFVLLRIERSL